jgi:hypothetical protein
VDIKKIPLQYVTNKATRFAMKAVGSLKVKEELFQNNSINGTMHHELEADDVLSETAKAEANNIQNGSMAKPTLGVDLASYRPEVKDGIWYISPIDVELLASGAGILGTGGGGSPYLMALYTLDILRKGGAGTMRVVPLESLNDHDVCVFGAGYGAPSVSNERIGDGTDVFAAIDAVNTIMGIQDFQGIVADEIGGGNGLVTLPTSARYDRPVVDCDLMGRAYPTLEHGTPYVYGQPVLPFAIADCQGHASVVLVSTTTAPFGPMVANANSPRPDRRVQQESGEFDKTNMHRDGQLNSIGRSTAPRRRHQEVLDSKYRFASMVSWKSSPSSPTVEA